MLKLKVKEIAESQGLTGPVDLASRTRIAYATAYRLWQGDVGTDTRGVGILVLYKVARGLGVKLWDLVEDVPEGQPVPALAGSM